MKEVKDPEIKLFGRKIVCAGGESSAESSDESNAGSGGGVECDRCSGVSTGRKKGEKVDEEEQLQAEEVQMEELFDEPQDKPDENPKMNRSNSDEHPRTPSEDEDAKTEENEQTDSKNGKQTLKKPDKVLPCPRCNSMETKFCYYNNYNVNQPRHFCKSCQRYWTAGGTMRNVPVGAGRRKNKNSASHCHHITISDALQATRIDAPNGFHHPAFKPNGCSVLSFGANTLMCDTMASSGFSHADKRVPNVDRGDSVSCKNAEDCSVPSSVLTTNSMTDGSKIGPSLPCIPGAPWPFPLPAIYPIPFFPYLNLPNAWNVPCLSMPSSFQKPTGSGPSSPLGKHSRTEPKDSENTILVPKTLRIDDPEEAAKSSIWETLGIKYDSTTRDSLFKALQPKGDKKKLAVSPSPALQANPAALSRFITFHEGA